MFTEKRCLFWKTCIIARVLRDAATVVHKRESTMEITIFTKVSARACSFDSRVSLSDLNFLQAPFLRRSTSTGFIAGVAKSLLNTMSNDHTYSDNFKNLYSVA